MGGAVRYLGGVRFVSEGPGLWYSESGHLAIHAVMGGEWELYRTRSGDTFHARICGTEFNSMAEHIESALTLGEIGADGLTMEDHPADLRDEDEDEEP